MGPTRAIFKLVCFALVFVIVVPLQSLILCLTRGPVSYVVPQIFHKALCLIFQIRMEVIGPRPDPRRQTLLVSNHLSYLDIPVIGSVIRASFVAKQDVSGWPVFGFLSKLQQTLFIGRERGNAKTAKSSLESALEAGKSLILFPEGTSSDGQGVFPFKSSLFALAYQRPGLSVQPFCLIVKTVDGHSVQTQEDRDHYAWHVHMEMDLGPHLWRFAKGRGAHIQLVFMPKVMAQDFEDRKMLAQACYDQILKTVLTHQKETP